MDEQPPRSRGRPPLPDGEAADAHIHLRSQRGRKSAYVRAANRKGQTLAAWIFATCDREAGYADDA